MAEVKITLTLGEWIAAVAVGIVRHGIALFKGSQPDWQDGTEDVHHLKGGLSESAYHKWRGIWWEPVINNYEGADAPGNVQIRSTSRQRPYHKVKPSDPDDQIVVFIESQERVHFIVGWLPMKAAKLLGRLEDPGGRDRPCLHLEKSQMLPPETLQLDCFSKCGTHGVYPGDGECPMCLALQAA